MMNDIILIALPDEAPKLRSRIDVFYTGVGKVNAALNAGMLIERHKPKRVFNFGTAGGLTVEHGGIYHCTTFSQRDYFVSGSIVSQEHATAPINLRGGGLHLCTGDNFVTDSSACPGADLVDMEGYAIAWACWKAGVEFICHKYVSDKADSNAAESFGDNIHKGQDHYERLIKQYAINE